MIHAQSEKIVQTIAPQAIVDNNSFTSNVIDTRGFHHCMVYFMLGATDIALTAAKLQEADVASDATTLTSGADVTGCIMGTSTQISGSASTLPSATDDNKIYCFEVPLGGSRKRYLKPVITMGDGSTGGFVTSWAVLSRADESPVSAASRGCGQILRAS